MPRPPKGSSPFYPGQPVPVELFVGRKAQIDHIVDRGLSQVSNGKPIAMYIQGEYGIGKSSIAGFVQRVAESRYGLHGIYAPLGMVDDLEGVGAAILEATLRSGAMNPTRSERMRSWLAKYIGERSLFGLTVRLDAVRKDAPTIAAGILPFLSEVLSRLQDTDVKGLLLVLDEINGITSHPKFAHFIKTLVDSNAMARQPVPLLLMLCGVEERRREMIRNHQPIDRIFDVIEVETMSPAEMRDFFLKSFGSAQIKVQPDAMNLLVEYSAGFPKIMHLVGDAAFWLDQDGVIDAEEAYRAIIEAADEVGKKYVDQQVYSALRSRDYRSILDKIAEAGLHMSFSKAQVAAKLTEAERKKLNNFLQKMKRLNVLRPGGNRGEYLFTVRMVGLYIWLNSLRKRPGGERSPVVDVRAAPPEGPAPVRRPAGPAAARARRAWPG